jgi:hypothetical protein
MLGIALKMLGQASSGFALLATTTCVNACTSTIGLSPFFLGEACTSINGACTSITGKQPSSMSICSLCEKTNKILM